MTSRSATRRRPFSHKARSPQVRTHTFTAQSPDLRHFALITRASRSFAHSPCSAAPSIRFLFIDSRFMLHASSPHSVALMQLRFTSFAVINLRRDFHPQACARTGAQKQKPAIMAGSNWVFDSVLLSHGECHTTIGATAFHFCVRHGYRWFHCAIAARQNLQSGIR